MKKKQLALLSTAVAFALLMTGCNLGMADTVRIVTDPTFQVNLGERLNVLTDTINLDEELNDAISDNADVLSINDVGIPYDVDGDAATDDQTVKSIRMEMDLFNYSINDFAGENLNLDSISQDIDPVEFTIPEINSNQSFATGFDPIALPIDASIPTVSIPSIPEVDGTATVSTPTAITAEGFDSMTFDSGTLSIAVAITGGSGSQTVTINSAQIMNGATEVTNTSNTPVTADGTLTFPLSGVTLPSSFTIDFSVTVTDAAPINTFTMDLTSTFSGDTTVTAATGITVDESLSDTVTVPLGNADLVSADIGTGGIDIDLSLDPSWTNLETTMDWTLRQGATVLGSAAGISVDNTDSLPGTVEIDLAGVSLTAADLTLDYTVYVQTAIDQTSDFSVTSGVDEVSGTATAGITSFNTLVLTVPDMDFTDTIIENLSSDVTDNITSITFADTAAVTMQIVNNLPGSTTIDVTLNSTELGLSGTNSFASGTNSDSWSILDGSFPKTLTIASITDSADDADTDVDLDLGISVSISGYNSTNSQLTLNNVNAKATYGISGTVTTDLSIQQVVISGVNLQEEYPDVTGGEDPMDLSMLSDYLPDTITFPGIAPELLLNLDTSETMNLKVFVHVDYKYMDATDTEQTVSLDLIGTDTNSDGTPETYGEYDEETSSIPLDEVGTMINRRAYDIVFTYDVMLNGATINVSGSDQRMQTAVAADIPLLLNSSGDTKLVDENDEDIIPAMDEDIFGRTAEDDEMSTFIDFLKSASIDVTYKNAISNDPDNQLVGFRLDVVEDTNPAGESDFNFSQTFQITDAPSGNISLALDENDFDRIAADSTFMPRFELYLLDGNHYLPQGFDFDISAQISIQSEVDTTLDELMGEDE